MNAPELNEALILETLRHGRIANCDIGTINGRNFLLILGVGFDGEVVRRLHDGGSFNRETMKQASESDTIGMR